MNRKFTTGRLFRVVIAMVMTLSLGFTARAGEDELSAIAAANAKIKTLSSGFERTKIIKASGRKTTVSGQLYYSANNCLAMEYTAPCTDKLVIRGRTMQMRMGQRAGTYDLSKNVMMSSLATTLLRCIDGNVAQVAKENSANISVKSGASEYEVTLSARQQAARGYSKIVLRYRKSDKVLIYMEMEEFSGIVTTYSMSEISLNPTIDEKKFNIEARKPAK